MGAAGPSHRGGLPLDPERRAGPLARGAHRADVWLQARCYEATLRALARRPAIEGVYFWLWERSSPPPFRDPSHAIAGKPAAFTMARWFSRAGG